MVTIRLTPIRPNADNIELTVWTTTDDNNYAVGIVEEGTQEAIQPFINAVTRDCPDWTAFRVVMDVVRPKPSEVV